MTMFRMLEISSSSSGSSTESTSNWLEDDSDTSEKEANERRASWADVSSRFTTLSVASMMESSERDATNDPSTEALGSAWLLPAYALVELDTARYVAVLTGWDVVEPSRRSFSLRSLIWQRVFQTLVESEQPYNDAIHRMRSSLHGLAACQPQSDSRAEHP